MRNVKGWRLEAAYQATRAESIRIQRNAAILVAESGVDVRSYGFGAEMFLEETEPERPGRSWSLRFTASEEQAGRLREAIISCFSECGGEVELRRSEDGDATPPESP